MFKAVKIAVITGLTGLLLATGMAISPAQAGEVPPNERLWVTYSNGFWSPAIPAGYDAFEVRLRNQNGTLVAPGSNTYELRTYDCFGDWMSTATFSDLAAATTDYRESLIQFGFVTPLSTELWGINVSMTAWTIPAGEPFSWVITVKPTNGDNAYNLTGNIAGPTGCGTTIFPRNPNSGPDWNSPDKFRPRMPGGNSGPTAPLTKVKKWGKKVGKAKVGKVVKVKRPKVAKGTKVSYTWMVGPNVVKSGPAPKLRIVKPWRGGTITVQARAVQPNKRTNVKQYSFGKIR